MVSQRAVRHRIYGAGIGTIALAALAYQVLLTRIFSVMLYYHFAFAGISLAMLGMTIGAQKVYLYEKRFSSRHLEDEWAKAALGFSISSVVLVAAFLYIPLLLPQTEVLSFLLFLFVIPFTYSGICVTLLLTKADAPVGKIYAADLVGASLGCIGIVGVLFFLDPVTVALGLALMTAFAACLMARKSGRLAFFSKAVTALWLVLFVLHGGLYLTDQPHLGVVWAKGKKLENVLFERWNAFSLIRVAPSSDLPFGWGFGHKHSKPGPGQLLLDIDAQAGTVISHFNGKNLKPFAFLGDDVINMGYHIHPVHDVAVIGVGGGRDLLSALYFGADHITGIELNPSILEALTRRLGDFSGHLERLLQISLINAEARSWLNQSHMSFDLVQISLIDTWAATAASGLTLSESKLYTVDAWKDFMQRLTPGGMLAVSRWFEPINHRGEFYRLLSIASEALRQRGVPESEMRQHILAFGAPAKYGAGTESVITVIISPDPFTAEGVANARAEAKKHNFDVMIDPETAWDDTSGVIASGAADKMFYKTQPLDVSAPTDDRPFFFHMSRLQNVFSRASLVGKLGTSDMSNHFINNTAIQIIFFLLLGTLLSTIYFVAVPLVGTWKRLPDKKGVFLHLGYFAGIGVGFMLIEISQMQRLMIFLGHPVYGLTVVLFTLLLFGGIGSATIGTSMQKNRFPLWLRPAMLCAVLCVTGAATPFLTEQLKSCGTVLRVLTSVAFLAPVGFCMGMMFPLGMIASAHYRKLQSWFWGVNGATSVFGSVLGVVISMESGIASAFWTGAACYAFCAFLIYKNRKV